MLVGERPGLVTDKSMSAYITYEARTGVLESQRTVVSNIHAQGTPRRRGRGTHRRASGNRSEKGRVRRGPLWGGRGMSPVKVLAVRYLQNAALSSALGTEKKCLAMVTTDCDDAPPISPWTKPPRRRMRRWSTPGASTPGLPTPPSPTPGRSSAFLGADTPGAARSAMEAALFALKNLGFAGIRRGQLSCPYGQQCRKLPVPGGRGSPGQRSGLPDRPASGKPLRSGCGAEGGGREAVRLLRSPQPDQFRRRPAHRHPNPPAKPPARPSARPWRKWQGSRNSAIDKLGFCRTPWLSLWESCHGGNAVTERAAMPRGFHADPRRWHPLSRAARASSPRGGAKGTFRQTLILCNKPSERTNKLWTPILLE